MAGDVLFHHALSSQFLKVVKFSEEDEEELLVVELEHHEAAVVAEEGVHHRIIQSAEFAVVLLVSTLVALVRHSLVEKFFSVESCRE